jgi:hypothetical protein
MQGVIPDFENIEPYRYQETVFVTGDLPTYLDDLERYFRGSARDLQESTAHQERRLRDLNRVIESHERRGIGFLALNGIYDYGYPDRIDKNNYRQAREWCERRLRLVEKLHRVQRVNHGRLMGIIEDGERLEELDLTNYANIDSIVRIAYDDSYGDGSIRMRIFFDASDGFKYYGQGFADHANGFDGVDAICEVEDHVTDDLPTLDTSLENGRIRRSRLRVSAPAFEVNHEDDEIVYSIELSEAEREMLRHFPSSKPELIRYGSRMWSPYQGDVIMRNLFGIFGIVIEWGARKDWYRYVFVPSENEDAVKLALEGDGVFTKTVDRESLTVLSALHDRTKELRETHGSGFYPRFTVREAAHRGGLSMKKTREYLDHLIGVLAFTQDSKKYKWFIPRSRFDLVEEILGVDQTLLED